MDRVSLGLGAITLACLLAVGIYYFRTTGGPVAPVQASQSVTSFPLPER